MFHRADLALRHVAAALPSRAGYALTRRLTPALGGDRRRWVGTVVREAALRLLGDQALATAAGERFVAEMACDDLDAMTAVRWPEDERLAATALHGAGNLPETGPAVVTSFHFSGGFRVFDVLRARGLTPTFLHAPPAAPATRYEEAIAALRTRHLRAHLSPPWVEPGIGARATLEQILGRGGVVVALLDVAPSRLDLRDRAACTLLGRPLRLPVGLLRLAARHGAPVIPYSGWIDDDRRTLEFHPPARGTAPESLLEDVLGVCEGILRRRPWTWQGWLDAGALFSDDACEREQNSS